MLRISSAWTSACMDTSDHGMSHPFKRPRAVTNYLKGITMHCSSASSFSFGAKCTRGFKCPYRLEHKRLRSTHCCVVPRKPNVCGHTIWISFLVLVWGIQSWNLCKHFRYTLYSMELQGDSWIIQCKVYGRERSSSKHYTIFESDRLAEKNEELLVGMPMCVATVKPGTSPLQVCSITATITCSIDR